MKEVKMFMHELHWLNDLDGEDCGYPEFELVGLYLHTPYYGPSIQLYIDMESGKILDLRSRCDCE